MKCTGKTVRGRRCSADAMTGSQRCFFHSPKTAQAAREAQRRGGAARMLALRPDAVLGPVTSPGTALAPSSRVEPPGWWKLGTRDDVLEGLRDVTRATLARKLDPRSANTAILAMREILTADRERRAAKRARREWARMQLRDRLESLVEDVQHLERSAPEGSRIREQLGRFDNEVEYITRLAARARI